MTVRKDVHPFQRPHRLKTLHRACQCEKMDNCEIRYGQTIISDIWFWDVRDIWYCNSRDMTSSVEETIDIIAMTTGNGPLITYVKSQVARALGMLETFSPPTRVSDPDMHHGTCVTHVPWCMLGSLTGGFLWRRWRGKRSRHSQRTRNLQFYQSRERPMRQYCPFSGLQISYELLELIDTCYICGSALTIDIGAILE